MMLFGTFDQNDSRGGLTADLYDQRLSLAQLYERRGFHIYQMSEHHGTPLSTTPSPSVFLAALSQRTTKLRFGPLVYLLPAYNPLRLVEEICMLDHLSRGRFEFGVGRGASSFEMGYMGVAADDMLPMYAEAVEMIREGLIDGRMTRQGRFWRYDDVELSVRPYQQPLPQMWAAISSPDSAVWPAAHGLNIVVGAPPPKAREVFRRFLSERAASGKASGAPLMGINRYIVVADTDAEALTLGSRAWERFYQSFFKLWAQYGATPGNNLPNSFEAVIARGNAVAGSPETVLRILEDQVTAAGANFLSGSFVFGDMSHDEAARSINLFADHVMPVLASSGAQAHSNLLAAA